MSLSIKRIILFVSALSVSLFCAFLADQVIHRIDAGNEENKSRTAVFTDGTATAKFTVVAAPEPAPTPAQPTVLPRTGDPAVGTLFGATVVLLTVLGVSCVAVARAKQRKRG